MVTSPLRILLIGAHPDDVEIKAGGTAARWTALGHRVMFVSMTDGRSGHHAQYGPDLVRRRRAEAAAAAGIIGATSETLDAPDGALDDRLEYRERVIRLLRRSRPDLVVTHRSNDYHPDHRFASLLVQDASYLVTVPAVCPDEPHLARSPVIMYFSDAFTKPCSFEPHVVVDIDDKFETLMAMLDCHVSQFYEWLPYNGGILDQVPVGTRERRAWLEERMRKRIRPLADRFREAVVGTYGLDRGKQIEYIEAFEVSEFGAPLDAAERARLFPFLPKETLPAPSLPRKEWADTPKA